MYSLSQQETFFYKESMFYPFVNVQEKIQQYKVMIRTNRYSHHSFFQKKKSKMDQAQNSKEHEISVTDEDDEKTQIIEETQFSGILQFENETETEAENEMYDESDVDTNEIRKIKYSRKLHIDEAAKPAEIYPYKVVMSSYEKIQSFKGRIRPEKNECQRRY